jgi:hypothetical protein
LKKEYRATFRNRPAIRLYGYQRELKECFDKISLVQVELEEEKGEEDEPGGGGGGGGRDHHEGNRHLIQQLFFYHVVRIRIRSDPKLFFFRIQSFEEIFCTFVLKMVELFLEKIFMNNLLLPNYNAHL